MGNCVIGGKHHSLSLCSTRIHNIVWWWYVWPSCKLTSFRTCYAWQCKQAKEEEAAISWRWCCAKLLLFLFSWMASQLLCLITRLRKCVCMSWLHSTYILYIYVCVYIYTAQPTECFSYSLQIINCINVCPLYAI